MCIYLSSFLLTVLATGEQKYVPYSLKQSMCDLESDCKNVPYSFLLFLLKQSMGMITGTADLLDIRSLYPNILGSSNFGKDGQYIVRVGKYESKIFFICIAEFKIIHFSRRCHFRHYAYNNLSTYTYIYAKTLC